MLDLMPAMLWCLALLISVAVIIICVIRGRLLHRYSGAVPIVSWNVVYAHVACVVLGSSPYMVYVWYADGDAFDPDVRDFYASWGWPSAVVFILLLIVQWICMYVQARRAARSQMDAVLGSVHASDRSDL